MQQQTAHLGLLWGRKGYKCTASAGHARAPVFLNNFWKTGFDCENFIAALFWLRGGSILSSNTLRQRGNGLYVLHWLLLSRFLSPWLNGNYWRFPTRHWAQARWGCPDPALSRGERQELSKLTPLPAPTGSSPPAAAPRGLLRTPANQLHLFFSLFFCVEEISPECMYVRFSPLLPIAPLKSSVSVSLRLERVR